MGGAPEFLDDNPHVDHAHARAAVLLGNEEPGDAELGEPLPHRVGRAPRVAV